MAMNAVGNYWQLLGQGLERGLQAGGHSFAELASQVLQSTPAPPIDALAVADWMIDAGTLPTQVNFTSGFGEPPLVVYQTPEFYIELLFWFPGPTAIHGHAFTGAFMVLEGISIQVEYAFHDETMLEERVRFGRLEPRRLEFIAPGKVCKILRGEGFIHAVTHLGHPSLTLVIRTYGDPNPRQFRFHRNGFAIMSGGDRSVISRQAAVLAAVCECDAAAFPARLLSLLQPVGDWHFYCLLETLLDLLKHSKFTKNVLPLVEARFAATRARALEAICERVRTRGIWNTVRALPKSNPRVEVQAALADFFPDAAEREAMLCKSYGIAHVSELPERWRSLTGTQA